jgi:putative ABC transport system ATP-binding protein
MAAALNPQDLMTPSLALSQSAPPSIRLQNVSLTLAGPAGPVNILRDVALEVAPGEALGLVGPSGSGKSSLLMLMAGLERATAGEVVVDGFDYRGQSEDRLARFRRESMGIVFQSFHLMATMTALENVAIPLELAGRPDALAAAKAQLERVGLGHRLGHYPGQLSGGEQQRVALARAFAMRPRILLADEPTGNLDQTTGHAIIELLFALQREVGASLVLITHDPELAARCDRVIALRDGQLA